MGAVSPPPGARPPVPPAQTPPRAATKKCPFCAEEILAEAVKCKHCQSSLTAQAPAATPVIIGRVDPGAELLGEIHRSPGSISRLGYTGIGIGILSFVLGISSGSVGLMGGGLFFVIASFLWARRPKPART